MSLRRMLFLAVIMVVPTLAGTPVGCVDLRLTPSGGRTIGTPGGAANCETACASYTYFYWQSDGDFCYCLNSAGIPSMYVGSAGIDSQGTCASNYAAAFKIGTTFRNTACYSSITPTGRSSSPAVSSPDGCFSACGTYTYAAFARSSGGYTCQCYDGATTGSSATCGLSATTLFTYSHSPDARASGLARRRVADEQKTLQMAKVKACPGQMVECPIAGHSAAFECIDDQNDLESCGGCTEPTTIGSALGVNCLTIPGVNPRGVSCRHGSCLVSKCRPGWRLMNGECVQIQKSNRRNIKRTRINPRVPYSG